MRSTQTFCLMSSAMATPSKCRSSNWKWQQGRCGISHSVYHPRKGKLPVVFDCGADYKGVLLNTLLLQGPNLTSALLGVLMRFRQEEVAIMGDVKAMFHQVKVSEENKVYLRFLWWPQGNLEQNLEEHRMTTHLFGAVSLPSVACHVL